MTIIEKLRAPYVPNVGVFWFSPQINMVVVTDR